jgi:hypothetical protein
MEDSDLALRGEEELEPLISDSVVEGEVEVEDAFWCALDESWMPANSPLSIPPLNPSSGAERSVSRLFSAVLSLSSSAL